MAAVSINRMSGNICHLAMNRRTLHHMKKPVISKELLVLTI